MPSTGSTGRAPNPPDEPVPGNFCTSAPARPFLYEGVFAHEYQHLLEHYEDGDEVNWINEGLADWAQTLTGYVNPALPVTDKGFDSHIQCFTGFLEVATPANVNPSTNCGPENSLTRWEDQGPLEILADYGAAYTMMELLHGRYGTAYMSALHRGDANGFDGVDEALAATGNGKADAQSIFDDWTLSVALDGLIDDGYKTLGSANEKSFTVPTLDTTIRWASANAYSTPGAPSNGSDYVQLRNGSQMLTGGQIQSLGFKGATTLPTAPLAWTIAANPPGQTGDPALYSGSGTDRDEAAVTPITVPPGSPSLTFNALWNMETRLGLRLRPDLDGRRRDVHVDLVHRHDDGSRSGRRGRGRREAAGLHRRLRRHGPLEAADLQSLRLCRPGCAARVPHGA